MDRKDFVEQFIKTDEVINRKRISEIMNESIDSNLKDGNPRGHKNLIIVMEEMAELIQEVSKELRGKGDYFDLLQELADVQISICYIQQICKISDIDLMKAINVKIKRIENILKETGEFN